VTGADFSAVDIDLLADYVGGVLDGTPDAARVAALIAEDPRWGDAYTELTAGMASVGAELGALGAVAEPMPAEVAARLDAVLADASRAETPVRGAASDQRLVAVPGKVVASAGSERAGATRARLRRRLRWAGPVAVAAGVLGIVAVGVDRLGGMDDSAADSSAAGSAALPAPLAASAEAGDARVAAEPPAGRITTSGKDYQPGTLRSVTVDDGADKRASAAPAEKGIEPDSALLRLKAQDALRACLDAIAVANGAGPITVTAVDYARYAGSPAVIVAFTAANGSWVWASGPECGTPDIDPATLGQVQVR
jgi:hypothetical protein